MSLHQWINLALLVIVLLIAAVALVKLLMQDWLPIRHDRAMATYRPQYSDEDAVSAALAAVGAEARAGCPCQACDRIRATTVEVLFRVTADDITELDRIGITWGPQ